MLLLTLLATLSFALAAPTTHRHYKPNCTALIEDKPWHINSLTTFQAHPAPYLQSYISFTLVDINKGLELNTTCSRYLALGSAASLSSPEYFACKNNTARFLFEDGALHISRFYLDRCLGDPPYDGAIAYGQANVTLRKTSSEAGILGTRTEMRVPISSLS